MAAALPSPVPPLPPPLASRGLGADFPVAAGGVSQSVGMPEFSCQRTPSCEEFFPMMVVASRVVLALKSLRPYQEFLKAGLVKRMPQSSIVAFISHQWLARHHPDPEGVQLRCLQQFLGAAVLDQIEAFFSEHDWAAFKNATMTQAGVPFARSDMLDDLAIDFSRHLGDAPNESVSAELAQCFVWLDYLSVPQDVQPSDDSQLRAIHSIPYYIGQSSFFIVLCPSAQHSDTGELSDYDSWLDRGWCRFEVWANVLSRNKVLPIVLTDLCAWTISVDDVFSSLARARIAAVGCGDYTCCRFGHKRADGTSIPCDKDSILPVLESMWRSKIREASRQEKQTLYQFFRVMETQLFARSPDAPFHATWGQESTNDGAPKLVLERIEADRAAGLVLHQFPDIELAAALGDERILQACATRGDDPMLVDSDGDTCLMVACLHGSLAAVEYLLSLPNMTSQHVNLANNHACTALHNAVPNERIVASLLRSRADPVLRNISGEIPLHGAAMHGQECSLRMLLDASAPVDAQDLCGQTALHIAAESTVLGRRVGRLRVMQVLLEYGASSAILDSGGLTVGDVAMRSGFRAAVSLLRANKQRNRECACC